MQGVTTSKGQENRSVPLQYPSDGSPPRAGEDAQSPPRTIHRPSRMAHGSGPLSPNPSPPEGGEGSLADAEIKARAGPHGSMHGRRYKVNITNVIVYIILVINIKDKKGGTNAPPFSLI